MSWTSRRPRARGYYWARRKHSVRVVAVLVTDSGGVLVPHIAGSRFVPSWDQWDLFCGPDPWPPLPEEVPT